MRKLAPAFAAAVTLAFAPLVADADTLSPTFGRTIELGGVSGVAYYTVEKDGFRVIATLADFGSKPVRFEAILAPGQSVVVSSPNGYGEAPAKVQISRQNDDVRVEALPVTN